MAKLILIIPLIAMLILGTTLVYSQGPPPNSGPPKVDIFARQVGYTAILVTWENPDDTTDNIVFQYTVSRDVNTTEVFSSIFSSLRNIEEKVIDTNEQEMFFYLDEDIKPGSNYTYQISVGNVQGNPNPNLSDDTRPITINPQVFPSNVISKGHLIVGKTLTPITQIAWWESFIPLVNAETFVQDIFTTTQNPQQELYRLALEPIPNPDGLLDRLATCDQSLRFQYSKDVDEGQNFDIVTTIIEKEIIRDDNTGVEIETEIETIRHQKTMKIDKFAVSNTVKQKWLVINPEDQTIRNFTNLEVQFDITGENVTQSDYRSLTFWNVYLLVPSSKNC